MSLRFSTAQQQEVTSSDLLAALALLVGSDNVHAAFADRFIYARDRMPWATFNLREGRLPGGLPIAIVTPASHTQVRAVVRLANERGVPIIPFGAGSGVLGGTIPSGGELMVDLKRLNRISLWHETDLMVTVEAGMNGAEFERQLNERGYTCGHYPQSMNMSTVGGWVACRGAGQASTRYGKIEDMVRGMTAVLPNGDDLEVRAGPHRAVGPSLQDLLVGAEGTLGVITSATLSIRRMPPCRRPLVLAFPTLHQALKAGREMLQTELRPAVFRLYDEVESKARTEGIAVFEALPFLCMLEFHGSAPLVAVESSLAEEIARHHGALVGPETPFANWLMTRYESYSARWQTEGYFMDTVEIAAPWSRIPGMYESMKLAVRNIDERIFFGTHWSHAYPEGACQYMTMRLPPMPTADGLAMHARVWDTLQTMCLEQGGSISHHHGIGLFRSTWFKRELGGAHGMLYAIKKALDPQGLFNPGKLGL